VINYGERSDEVCARAVVERRGAKLTYHYHNAAAGNREIGAPSMRNSWQSVEKFGVAAVAAADKLIIANGFYS